MAASVVTARQLEVLRTIAAETKARGYAPTLRELGDALGITSANGVADHLHALKRKGLVTHDSKKSCTLRLTVEGVAALRFIRTPSKPPIADERTTHERSSSLQKIAGA